jgi:chromosomal replication initiation ATPase DnaA
MRAKSPLAVLDDLQARDLLVVVLDVCRCRGVRVEDVCARKRFQSVSRARQEIWWRLRNHAERHYSLSEIARLFGRDPTTVLAGVAAHDRRRPADASTSANAHQLPSNNRTESP